MKSRIISASGTASREKYGIGGRRSWGPLGDRLGGKRPEPDADAFGAPSESGSSPNQPTRQLTCVIGFCGRRVTVAVRLSGVRP